MAFVAPPLTLPSPATWWQDPKVRGRLIAAAVLVAAYVTALAYGSWTRVCAAERCPSISRLIGGPGPQQTSKVYAADGRLITELGLERRTVLALRSEEHTSELQSQSNLVCRLLLEKKKKIKTQRGN